MAGLPRLVASFARSREGVDFESIDGQPTHLFFLLVVPEHSGGQHLKALARISRFFRDAAFRKDLAEAETARRRLPRHRRGRRQVLARLAPDGGCMPAPVTQVHGALVEVLGVGVLLLGPERNRQERDAPSSSSRAGTSSWPTTSCACAPTPRGPPVGMGARDHPALRGDPRHRDPLRAGSVRSPMRCSASPASIWCATLEAWASGEPTSASESSARPRISPGSRSRAVTLPVRPGATWPPSSRSRSATTCQRTHGRECGARVSTADCGKEREAVR